jgi:DNA polymerase-3 subunit gamma/tau
MEYQVFALKYRPRNFGEVIGQAHATSALKNAILKQRVHHAYLFSGPRGIGKTSLARILAKSLNCEKGPTVKPCGECIHCREIAASNCLDVIEIDGASNRGIDQIRELRESVKVSPNACRYKVYIIDEVHMLTQEAFNALLKTLEEPPAHVKFIFATTHPHKLPPTIISRCQKFQFRLLEVDKIFQKLAYIVKQEKLNIANDILYSIAHAASGSIRDAESLLDQIAPVALQKGEVKEIISFLGVIDQDSLNLMVNFMLQAKLESALEHINKVIQDGKDLGVFINNLIEHLRTVLIAKLSPRALGQLNELSPQTISFIKDIARKASSQRLVNAIDLLLEAKILARQLPSVRIPFELAVIKFCSPELSKNETRLENEKLNLSAATYQKIKATKPQSQPKPRPKPRPKPGTTKRKISIDELDLEDNKPAPPKASNKNRDNVQADKDISFNQIKKIWQAVIKTIGKKKVSLAAYLREAQLDSFKDGVLKIAFSPKYSFHKEVVGAHKNLSYIENCFYQILDKKIIVRCVTSEKVQDHKSTKEENDSPVADKNEDSQFINELLDSFGGQIHTE